MGQAARPDGTFVQVRCGGHRVPGKTFSGVAARALPMVTKSILGNAESEQLGQSPLRGDLKAFCGQQLQAGIQLSPTE